MPATAERFYNAFNWSDARPWAEVGYADALAPPALAHLRVAAPLVDGKPTALFPKIELDPGAAGAGKS